jgi:hypothetical protein
MIYEYRKYAIGPGKTAALHERCEKVLLPLFDKHGMQPVVFFQPAVGPILGELHYVMRWPSADAALEGWGRFASDPEWIEAAAESERDGALVTAADSQLWMPTTYSPTP